MGTGIALTFAGAGRGVVLPDASPQALRRAAAALDGHYEAEVVKGGLEAGEAQLCRASIELAGSLDALAGCEVARSKAGLRTPPPRRWCARSGCGWGSSRTRPASEKSSSAVFSPS
jgi:NAD(P)-dependent dehydrogenase (short-subunit alcohol dehydrogenase family)